MLFAKVQCQAAVSVPVVSTVSALKSCCWSGGSTLNNVSACLSSLLLLFIFTSLLLLPHFLNPFSLRGCVTAQIRVPCPLYMACQ